MVRQFQLVPFQHGTEALQRKHKPKAIMLGAQGSVGLYVQLFQNKKIKWIHYIKIYLKILI